MATAKKTAVKKAVVAKKVPAKAVKPAKKVPKSPAAVISDAVYEKVVKDVDASIKAAKAAPVKPAKVEAGVPTKMQRATDLFVKMKDKPRSDVIAAFIEKVELTKAGANTYYQLIKTKQT